MILTNASDPAGNDGLTAENVSVEVTVSSEDEEDDEETEDETSGDSTGSGSGDDAPRENTDDSRDSGARDAGEDDDSGAPSNGQSSANASVSVRSPSPNQLDVVIERARVNQSVTLEVPSSFGQESMESDLSRIVILPARHTDLTLRLTEMRRPPDGVPHINASRPIEPMVYLTVGHSTSDQAFKRVRFYFVVDKAAGAGMMASPESVEVYRFSTGQWQELPTHLVNETPTSYVYVGESPGFSAFAFGYNTSGSRSPNSTQGLDDGRADIEITDAVVDESEVTQGENITVRATAENKGPATGRIQVTVRANGTTLIRDDRTVPAGTTREFVYHPQLETPGVVEITVNGIPSGAVEVTPSTGPGTTRSGGTTAARSEEASSEPFPTAPWGVGGVDGSRLSHGIIGWGAGIATLIIMFTVGYYGTGVYLRKGR